MLQEIKSIIPGYPDKFGYNFSDEVYLHGLKFTFKEKYPWKNRGEMKGFFEKLYTHKSADSYQKIIEWKTAFHQEQAHIYHSWALMLRFLSVLMFSSCLVLYILRYPVLSDILLITGIGLLVTDMWLSRMAAKCRHSWVLIIGLLKTMLAQEGKQVEAA
jgi:hypothetical protein